MQRNIKNLKYRVYAYLDLMKSGNYNEFSFNHELFYIGKGRKQECMSYI